MSRVDFSGEMFSVLAEGEKKKHNLPDYRFPEWDILKELDRRTKRTERDRGKGVREWMRNNPEKVEEIIRRRL